MSNSSIIPYGKQVFFRRPISRQLYNNFAGPMRGLGKRMRNRFAQSFTQQKRRRTQSGQGVTEQHDARLIYRKKNMGRRKKRRWKRFKNKVLAVSEKDLGSQTVVFNITASPTNVTSGNQLLFNCALYPSGSTTSYFDDLNSIGALNAGAVTTAATGLSVANSTKIIFKSAVLDITIRNSSFTTASSLGDSSYRMEVDVYECTITRVADEEGAVYADLLSLFAQNPTRTDPIGGGATTEVALTLRGVTPFDLTYALSTWGIKILRKTKYQINNGDQVTYQVRDPRRHTLTQRQITSTEGFSYPGLSRFVLVVGRLAPGITVGALGATERLDVGITRKYFYKVENWSEDRTAYVVA